MWELLGLHLTCCFWLLAAHLPSSVSFYSSPSSPFPLSPSPSLFTTSHIFTFPPKHQTLYSPLSFRASAEIQGTSLCSQLNLGGL